MTSRIALRRSFGCQRQVPEAVYGHLGRLEKELSWGKLRAEKWKRSVMSLMSLWEGWSVFPGKSHEEFVELFNNPPLTLEEKAAVEEEEKAKAEKERTKSKWKSVSNDKPDEKPAIMDEADDVDGEAMEEDLNGEPMVDEDLDGQPMEDEDVDGEPMAVDGENGVEDIGWQCYMAVSPSDTSEVGAMINLTQQIDYIVHKSLREIVNYSSECLLCRRWT